MVATAGPRTHLVGVGDQLQAAVKELGDYFAADPCPRRDLRDAYVGLLDIISIVAGVFVTWDHMGRHERGDAVELVQGLRGLADQVVAVAGPLS